MRASTHRALRPLGGQEVRGLPSGCVFKEEAWAPLSKERLPCSRAAVSVRVTLAATDVAAYVTLWRGGPHNPASSIENDLFASRNANPRRLVPSRRVLDRCWKIPSPSRMIIADLVDEAAEATQCLAADSTPEQEPAASCCRAWWSKSFQYRSVSAYTARSRNRCALRTAAARLSSTLPCSSTNAMARSSYIAGYRKKRLP